MVVDRSANSTEIINLIEYTQYTMVVQANTAVCIGDRSNTVTVVTNEDGKWMTLNVCMCFCFTCV